MASALLLLDPQQSSRVTARSNRTFKTSIACSGTLCHTRFNLLNSFFQLLYLLGLDEKPI